MKKLAECRPHERMLRCLLLIDGLCDLASDERNPIIDSIYQIAHVGAGLCHNKHEEWTEIVDAFSKKLKEENVVDVDKIIEQREILV